MRILKNKKDEGYITKNDQQKQKRFKKRKSLDGNSTWGQLIEKS
jgi:hypothetical protein